MQSRRDQLHAYRFQVRRAVASLVVGEPDVPEPPMRRLTITTIAGLMIAIVVAAGFAVVGLIRPSSTDAWREPGTVIVEKETGARFILVDGVLHPVLNYTSAVLALGISGRRWSWCRARRWPAPRAGRRSASTACRTRCRRTRT